jgi:hypothetical protein
MAGALVNPKGITKTRNVHNWFGMQSFVGHVP